jgi:GT2 family glycosyltransferase
MDPKPLAISLPSAEPGRPSGAILSVIIICHNEWPDIHRLLGTLVRTPEVASGIADVVVVDNDSQGPIPSELLEPTPGVRLVARTENGGFAAGVNSGWHAAEGRWLLLLNPDVVVPDTLLEAVLARIQHFEAEAAQAPGIVGFGLHNPDGSRQPSVGSFPSLPRTLWEQLIPRSRRKYRADWRTRAGRVPWATGACMLVNTRLLAAVGGMDEDFFLYYEEVALCRAAHRLGWHVEFDPSVAVTHLRPLQKRTLSPGMRVVTRHSKLLYFHKHLSHWQFLGLSWIISLEATIFGQWSSLTQQTEQVRAWRTIREMVRGFRAGVVLKGGDVRMLAEAVTRPPAPSRIGSARMRRGARSTPLLQRRKDGPARR